MADPSLNTSGRGRVRRGLSEFVDRAFLGNRAHDYQSGYWNRQGAIEGGIIGGAGAINPGLGLLARWYYNRRNQNQGNMPLDMTTLAPLDRFSFNYGGTQPAGLSFNQPIGNPQSPAFNPNNPFGVPNAPQQPRTPSGNPFGPFSPMGPAPSGFRSVLPSTMGGARAMHTRGGGNSLVGEAARSAFASMRQASAFDPIVDYSASPIQS